MALQGGISTHGRWGNPHEAARMANELAAGIHREASGGSASGGGGTHGMTASQVEAMRDRFETFVPGMAASHGAPQARAREFFTGMLPEGANLDPHAGGGYANAMRHAAMRRTGAGSIGTGHNLPGGAQLGGGTYVTNQRPYQPEFDSPDRQNYPVHRNLANIYWRLFYKLDPIIGTGVDLMAEMLWSNFELSGEGIDGEIKDALEFMCEETQFRAMLPYLVREFLVIGEVCPHLFWDDDEGIWTHIALHNPDQLEVIHSPFLKMEPLVEFKPEDRLRQILTSNNPMLKNVRETMPEEILAALVSGQNIPLSPVNCTFIPRKLHPYDIRGTSIISRMWRVLMYEDCYVAGTRITLADGTSCPIEQVKRGDVVLDRQGHRQRVTAAVERPAQAPYEVTLFGGTTLRATATHRWPVWAYPRTCQCGCGASVNRFKSFVKGHVSRSMNVDWVTYGGAPADRWSRRRLPGAYDPVQKLETKDLRVEDYLMVPRTFDEVETDASSDYARLLGYYLAEGSIQVLSDGESWGVHFDFHSEERETWAADVVALCARLGVNAIIYPVKGRKAISVHFHRHEEGWLAKKLVRDAGRFSHAKVLSADVMRWSVKLKKELLTGYLRGDGAVDLRLKPTRMVTVSAMTTSEALADQLWLVFAQVGWPLTQRRESKHKSRDGRNRRLRHEMVIKGAGADLVCDVVFGVKVERSTSERGSNAWSKIWMDAHFVYYPIKKIRQERAEVAVFGLSVDGDHSYLANGIATYNSLFNASIAIARRAAGPLKVAKLGDRNTGWIPDPAQERRLLELLTQAEIDPAAWLVYHYGVEFDLVGSQERAWKVEQTSEFIERVKLMALGISKSFLWGEVTYASAASGLTVFLQRLKALREFFESAWIYPKFFRPVAEMNKWIRPTQAELDHRVRTKRSKRELREDKRYIIPKVEWDKPLDPSIDSAMIGAIGNLAQLGVTFSKTTLASLVNRDYEKELEQRIRETKMELDLMAKHPELQQAMQAQQQAAGGGGGGAGGVSPGLGPPPDMGGGEGGGESGPPPDLGGGEGEPPAAAAGDEAAATEGHGGSGSGSDTRTRWDADGRSGAWGKEEALDLVRVLKEGDDPDEDPWRAMLEDWKTKAKTQDPYALAAMRALGRGDADDVWEAVQEWMLIEGGYPPRTIRELEAILKGEGVLSSEKTAMRERERVVRPPKLDQRARELERVFDAQERLAGDRLLAGAPQERRSAAFQVHAPHGRGRIP